MSLISHIYSYANNRVPRVKRKPARQPSSKSNLERSLYMSKQAEATSPVMRNDESADRMAAELQAEVKGSAVVLANIAEAIALLTTDDVRKLVGHVMSELRKRKGAQSETDTPQMKGKPVAAKVPVNHSPDHMAAMRTRRAELQAAKKTPSPLTLSQTQAALGGLLLTATVASSKQSKPQIKSEQSAHPENAAAAKESYKARKAACTKVNPIAVQKPTGELTRKRFSSEADALAWLASWCSPAKRASYKAVVVVG